MKVTFICEECKKEVTAYRHGSAKPRFCGNACKLAWMKREIFPKHKAPWLRELNLKPGRNAEISRRSADKRSATCRRNHPAKASSYLKEHSRHQHRRNMEVHLGYPLPSELVVHHVDGDKHNNDLSNLVVLTRAEHARLHFKKKGEKGGTER